MPHLAEVTVGVILVAIVSLVDVRSAVGFSAFTVLLYYAITNASAHTLAVNDRLYPLAFSTLGLVGCLVLAFTLSIQSVLVGAGVVILGFLTFLVIQGQSGR